MTEKTNKRARGERAGHHVTAFRLHSKQFLKRENISLALTMNSFHETVKTIAM